MAAVPWRLPTAAGDALPSASPRPDALCACVARALRAYVRLRGGGPGAARGAVARGCSMRRGERRGPGPGAALGKAALEEQQPPPQQPPVPNGGSPAAAAERPTLPGAERDSPGLRRSTESEVYDDGTNTFFW